MSARRMSIGAMRGCECGHHVWLILHEHEGGTHVGLRIHSELARWFDPEQTAATRLITGLAAVMRQAGCAPTAAIVTDDAERRVRVRLRVGDGAETDIECEPGVALLLAERTRLPILLLSDRERREEATGAPATAIPEVYRETLSALGLIGDASG